MPTAAANGPEHMTSALPERFPADMRCIGRILDRQAEIFPTRTLFVFEDSAWSFAEMRDKAARAGTLLMEAGVRHGDRVAIFCSNRPEFLELFLACGWIGAILVPVNIASRGPQLRHVLANCGARLLIVEAELAAAFNGFETELSAIETIWAITEKADAVIGTRTIAAMPPYPAAGAAMAGKPADTMAILYTSGTTGPAKGVCCPQAQFFWWGVNTARGLAIREGDVLFTTLPLFHTNALNCFWQALLTGSTYVLERKFSASAFWKSAAQHNAKVGYFLGAMAAILLSRPVEPGDRAHSMRVALGGGVPARFHQPFLERFGVPLLDAYGSTETNFVFSGDIPSKSPGTMGYLLDGFQARIVDDDDVEVADGESGELILRADEPFAFATGYFGMPEKTVESWRNLWFHTGDRVARDPDGNFRFVDRMKDAIRRRGENISSWEVEQVLLSHPSVSSCAVYGVPSELGEDEVMASIIAASGHTIEPDALLDFCQSRLAYFAVPRYLDFVDTLPLTENGKIQKVRLRERGITKTTWDREKFGYELKR